MFILGVWSIYLHQIRYIKQAIDVNIDVKKQIWITQDVVIGSAVYF